MLRRKKDSFLETFFMFKVATVYIGEISGSHGSEFE
jgi:hypothetical protein